MHESLRNSECCVVCFDFCITSWFLQEFCSGHKYFKAKSLEFEGCVELGKKNRGVQKHQRRALSFVKWKSPPLPPPPFFLVFVFLFFHLSFPFQYPCGTHVGIAISPSPRSVLVTRRKTKSKGPCCLPMLAVLWLCYHTVDYNKL
jgi:hypothetical protein